MTIKTLEDHYFEWLISQIETESCRGYYRLFEILHHKEFVWLIPNDDNRVADGLEVRKEFYRRGEDRQMPEEGVSVLETLVALSRRLAFNAGGESEGWAWTLIENLGLDKMDDPVSRRQEREIEDILHNLIWRLYERNGSGGFFPLRHSEVDQTEVEIWYQMNAYIKDHNLI